VEEDEAVIDVAYGPLSLASAIAMALGSGG
jgi:hypothetical protein